MFHDKHYISVKVALFSADLQRVLVMYYPKRDIYGLPGGHIDKNELPDEALARELKEELGVSVEGAQLKDSYRSGRIILAYTAIVPNDFETFPPDPKFEYAVWRTKAEVEEMGTLSDHYRQFILEYWPRP
ncbi:hypothetical protein BGO17_04605 [Candidatus Saccharibacteria bacterium 49-20]|nr:MAG: hypothetical protein BGO17_04605 [Candidatus Saccharibacteria bacterium 49-20]